MLFTQSLKKNFQFRYVYHKGRSFANRRLVMYIIKNGTAENRLGIARVSCNEASYWEVQDSLRHLMKKHNFFCPEEAEKK